MSARRRSTWHWGWEDALPDAGARRAIAAQLAAALGCTLPDERAPSEELRMPAPRVAPPPGLAPFATREARARALHTYGKGFPDLVRASRGDFGHAPDVVVLPRGEDEVAATLQWCAREGLAAIPFGGGTSVVAGVEADVPARYAAAVSIDLAHMDRVLEVDATSLAARAQAGVFGPALAEQLRPHGLAFRHFPQSYEHSTLGGWIATRAGGHYATLHTHVDDLVESVRMVTPRGVFATRRLPASGAGPDPARLVLGSEGALGVITEAWIRVQRAPRFRAQASVAFAGFGAAAAAARAVAQAGLYPANCRVLDPLEALLNGVAGGDVAVLLLGFESSDHPLEPWMHRALELAAAHGGTPTRPPTFHDDGAQARGEGAGTAWREAFLRAPYLQSALLLSGFVVDTFETACTWDALDALLAAVRTAVREATRAVAGVDGLLTCRFTHVYPDGPAPYFTFFLPGRAGEEIAQWGAVKRAASDALLAAGATITHHHAVGRLHRPWAERERPALFGDVLAAAKEALDPDGVMNPGALLAAPAARPPRA